MLQRNNKLTGMILNKIIIGGFNALGVYYANFFPFGYRIVLYKGFFCLVKIIVG